SRVQSLEERPSPLGNRLADDELTAVDDALRLVCTAVACVTAGGETDLDRFDPITEVEFAVQLVPRGDDALVERIVQHPPGRACRCLADARPRRAHVGGCRPERALHRVESAADRAELLSEPGLSVLSGPDDPIERGHPNCGSPVQPILHRYELSPHSV